MSDTTSISNGDNGETPDNDKPSTSTSSGSSLLDSLRNFRYQPVQKPSISSQGTQMKSVIKPATENVSRCISTQTMVSKPLNLNDMKRKLSSEMGKDLSPIKREKVEINGVSEKNIDFIHKLFPNKNRLDIQTALASSNTMQNKSTISSSSSSAHNWKKIQPAPISAINVKTVCIASPSPGRPPHSRVKPVVKPVIKPVVKPIIEDDSSDDDDCSYSRTKKHKILAYLSKAKIPELLAINSCTMKKAEIIIKQQPFKNWKQLNEKLSKEHINTSTLFDNLIETIRLQNEISILMKNCTDLSMSMTNKLSQLSSYREANLMSLGQQPKILSPELKLATYQMIGLGWLRLLHEQDVNGILADEMGLGKTVQVIAFLAYLKENQLKKAVHLIVVPCSTLENWSNELTRWCPSLNVQIYYGSQEDRRTFRFWWRDEKNKAEVKDVDILLTTYNLVNSSPEDKCFFRKMELQYIIYDEAHMLKNMATQRYSSLMRINGEHRVLLTGTPLQNNLVELMSLLVFVMPKMFAHKQEDLIKLFKTTPKGSNETETSEFASDKINQAKKIMEPFIMRRLKSDVLQDLPSKTEKVVMCDLTEDQKAMYAQEIVDLTTGNKNLDEIDEKSENGEKSDDVEETRGLSGSMEIMMRLRRVANHPVLIRHEFTDKIVIKIAKKLKSDRTYKDKKDKILDNLYEMSDHQIHKLCCTYKSISQFKLKDSYLLSSAKLAKLDELLPQLQKDDHRILIFSQFRQVMDVLEDYCNIRKYKFLRLDGTTPVVERQTLINDFNEDNSILIFLLSTRAGGFGINLASADTVIIHDIDLNPYNDKQAEDRCHRVGQVRPVTVMRLVSASTIEQTMLKIAQCKLSLEQQISQGRNSKESEKKLMQLLKEDLKLTH